MGTSGSTTKTVSGSFKITGMNYANLNANATLKGLVETQCQTTIAAKAGTAASNVVVTLSQGSVVVNYVITIAESSASGVASALQAAIQTSSNSMMDALLTALNAIDGISSAVDGTLAIADISTPVMSSDNADAATMGASSVYTAGAWTMAAFVTAHAF